MRQHTAMMKVHQTSNLIVLNKAMVKVDYTFDAVIIVLSKNSAGVNDTDKDRVASLVPPAYSV